MTRKNYIMHGASWFRNISYMFNRIINFLLALLFPVESVWTVLELEAAAAATLCSGADSARKIPWQHVSQNPVVQYTHFV